MYGDFDRLLVDNTQTVFYANLCLTVLVYLEIHREIYFSVEKELSIDVTHSLGEYSNKRSEYFSTVARVDS